MKRVKEERRRGWFQAKANSERRYREMGDSRQRLKRVALKLCACS